MRLLLTCWVPVLVLYRVWSIYFTGNSGGLLDYSYTTIPIFHLTAEFAMATTTLVGAVGLWRSKTWGRPVTLVGLGAFFYAGLSAMAWSLRNDPVIMIPLVLTTALVAVLGWQLAGDRVSTTGWRHKLRLALLLVCSLQIYGLWAMFLAQGAFADVLGPETLPWLPVPQLAGELLLLGVIAVATLRGHDGLLRFGLGMLLYSTINLLSWSVLHDHVLTLLLALTLGVAALAGRAARGTIAAAAPSCPRR